MNHSSEYVELGTRFPEKFHHGKDTSTPENETEIDQRQDSGERGGWMNNVGDYLSSWRDQNCGTCFAMTGYEEEGSSENSSSGRTEPPTLIGSGTKRSPIRLPSVHYGDGEDWGDLEDSAYFGGSGSFNISPSPTRKTALASSIYRTTSALSAPKKHLAPYPEHNFQRVRTTQGLYRSPAWSMRTTSLLNDDESNESNDIYKTYTHDMDPYYDHDQHSGSLKNVIDVTNVDDMFQNSRFFLGGGSTGSSQ